MMTKKNMKKKKKNKMKKEEEKEKKTRRICMIPRCLKCKCEFKSRSALTHHTKNESLVCSLHSDAVYQCVLCRQWVPKIHMMRHMTRLKTECDSNQINRLSLAIGPITWSMIFEGWSGMFDPRDPFRLLPGYHRAATLLLGMETEVKKRCMYGYASFLVECLATFYNTHQTTTLISSACSPIRSLSRICTRIRTCVLTYI